MQAFAKRTLLAGLLVTVSVLGYSQCQQQTCSDTGTCFKCSDTTSNVGCMVSSCESCSISRCKDPGGSTGGLVCDNLPHGLSELKLVSLGSQSAPNLSTVFAMLGEKGAPAELLSLNISRDSVLRHAELKNVGQKEITGYQLGWVFVSQSISPNVTLGPELRLAKSLATDATVEVAEHPFPSSFFDKTGETKKVGFFVAAVTFADGSSWKADLKRLEQDAATGNQPQAGQRKNRT